MALLIGTVNATCVRCGWVGPARRSSDAAINDSDRHAATHGAPRDKVCDKASCRRRGARRWTCWKCGAKCCGHYCGCKQPDGLTATCGRCWLGK